MINVINNYLFCLFKIINLLFSNIKVKMADSNFDSEDDFQIVSGSAKVKFLFFLKFFSIFKIKGEWARIEPDGSITHDITVKPLKSGQQNITSAMLTYKSADGKFQNY